MKKYLVCFATKEFKKSQEILIESAKKFGVDEVISFSPREISKTFYLANRDILDQRKGAGYWLWKPYVIFESLNRVENGDLILYLDCGVEVISDLNPLFNLCRDKGGVLLFQTHGQRNRKWTKRDCFVLMDCDNEYFHDAEQVAAGYQIYIKNEFSVKLVSEYLNYCKDERILTDISNTCNLPNCPDFIEHRHDQSILSLLALIYKIPINRDPSQWGNHIKSPELREYGEFLKEAYSKRSFGDSPYKTIFNHHRERTIPLMKKISLLTGLSRKKFVR